MYANGRPVEGDLGSMIDSLRANIKNSIGDSHPDINYMRDHLLNTALLILKMIEDETVGDGRGILGSGYANSRNAEIGESYGHSANDPRQW